MLPTDVADVKAFDSSPTLDPVTTFLVRPDAEVAILEASDEGVLPLRPRLRFFFTWSGKLLLESDMMQRKAQTPDTGPSLNQYPRARLAI